jgi:deoxyribose-phosphate aldolase
MSVEEVAKVLEIRAHEPGITAEQVAQQARQASLLGLAAILCRPEHVRAAAEAVRGTGVEVGTAVDFHGRNMPLDAATVLTEKTKALVHRGATTIALVATQQRLDVDCGRAFASAVQAVTAAAREQGAVSRVVIDVGRMDLEQELAAARLCLDAGASLIQVGVWDGRRANFGHMRQMRDALGPGVPLKWTAPVRSIDVLLLAVAEGMDRFNGDVISLLDEAESRAAWLPLTVPVQGWDYE